MDATGSDPLPGLIDRIESTLDADPEQPWCVHRLSEALLGDDGDERRDARIDEAQQAADRAVGLGRARREYVSAISIGVHCEDAVYWSSRSPKRQLAEFGPEYEAPTVLHRLASHVRCHGL